MAKACTVSGYAVTDDGRLVIGDRVLPKHPKLTFEKCVGVGANAVVFAAKDASLDRTVAAKLYDTIAGPHGGRAVRGRRLTKARSETKKLANLNDRAIVRVYDLNRWEGMCLVTMEYVGKRLK